MAEYNHKDIEAKWQQQWADQGTYVTAETSDKPKAYVLDMFPYPSGDGLHIGHPRGYIATDVFSRVKRMQGHNVLHPMGWDAFGLPAENHAIKNKIHPSVQMAKNIQNFKRQLSMLGVDYDWSREINTTDPNFYKWTQWMFLKMWEKGLAYESHEPINWCPSCQTGLANEDLNADGTCERCGSVVEKKPMRQWVLKITDYADRLLDDLEILDRWPDWVKEAQRNWIGRSEGSTIPFIVKTAHSEQTIEIFTTRADTLFGCTYFVLSPEHTFIHEHEADIKNLDEVKKYIASLQGKTEIERTAHGKEKTGVQLQGFVAINPANQEEIPVWIADYVLADYGTGAVMAVPAHDERDFAFAQKYDLEIRQVVDSEEGVLPAVGPGRLLASDTFTGMSSVEAKQKITEYVGGHMTVNYKLRDWVFSRQRYWGEPIPIVHCASCVEKNVEPKVSLNFRIQDIWDELMSGKKTVETRVLNPEEPERYFGDVQIGDVIECVNKNNNEKAYFSVVARRIFKSIEELWEEKALLQKISPNRVPNTLQEYKDGYASLAKGYLERLETHGLIAFSVKRLTVPVPVPEDQLPVELPQVESYEPTGTGESPLAGIDEWVQTTCPTCGAPAKRETNTMPQWAGSSWYYLRYIDPHNTDAAIDAQKEKYWNPVDVYVGGDHATRHLIYARFWHKFLHDIGVVSQIEPFPRLEFLGYILAEDGTKISKRKGNGESPDVVVENVGADTLRTYEMFIGPFEKAVPWSNDGLVGVRRFLEKVWRVAEKVTDGGETVPSLHKTIKKVTEDIPSFKFNTAVAQMMICVNEMDKMKLVVRDDFIAFLKILAPFAPHITEELWHRLGHDTSIHLEPWPEYDPELAQDDTVTLGVQVNGKVREEIEVAIDESEDSVKERVLAMPKIQEFINGKEIKKFIYVPGRIVSLVI